MCPSRRAAQGRTVRDFVRALRAVHAPEHQALEDHEALPAGAFDWRALAAVAAPYLRPAPGAGCLLGPLDAAPKARHLALEAAASAKCMHAPHERSCMTASVQSRRSGRSLLREAASMRAAAPGPADAGLLPACPRRGEGHVRP